MISPRAAEVVAGEAQPRAALAATPACGCAVLAVSFCRPYSKCAGNPDQEQPAGKKRKVSLT